MSDLGVYNDEMPDESISDRDAERIIAGKTPEQVDLADLALLKDTLNGYYVRRPSEEATAHFAAIAVDAAETPPGRATRSTDQSISLWARARQGTVGMAAGLAAAVLFATFSVLALVADGAAPGDPLYGIDRAVERLGIRDGGTAERVVEAQAILADGKAADAVEHVVEATSPSVEDDEAADALRATASHLRSNEDDIVEVQTRVAHMLEWMAGADPSSSGFEQRVAAIARGVSNPNDVEGTP